MESIQGYYDGQAIRPLEPIPVKGSCPVKIVFETPLNVNEKANRRAEFLALSGSWTEEDGKLIEEMISERKNFSKGREDYDFS